MSYINIFNAQTEGGLPKVKAVGFGVPEKWVGDDANARTIVDSATGQRTLVFNPKGQAEEPFQFSCIVFHETLHQDLPNSRTEEAVIVSLQTLISREQLSKHPKRLVPIPS